MEKDTIISNHSFQKDTSNDFIKGNDLLIVSNIELSEMGRTEYKLPEGYSWDAQLENGRIKDGIVTMYDEDGCLYKKMEYKNGKLNGICSYYDSGELVSKKTFVNDKEEGWACEIQMGIEVKWFLYENGRLKMELMKNDKVNGYWDAVSVDSHKIVSCCQYDANHQAFGKGYLYENGKIQKVVVLKNGEIIEVLKEFKNNVMIELDENNTKVYEGGFADCIDYPREGEGKEYEGGVIVYKGKWKKNKREGYGKSVRNGLAEYMGNWRNGRPDGEGVFMQDDEIVYKGNWKKGRYFIEDDKWFDFERGEIVIEKKVGSNSNEKQMVTKTVENSSSHLKVEIETGDELKQILANGKKTVVEMVIMENCGNELNDDLEICGFEKLKSIVVCDNSLINLNYLKIMNNPQLKSIVTKNGGFYSGTLSRVKDVEISSKLIVHSLSGSSPTYFDQYRRVLI